MSSVTNIDLVRDSTMQEISQSLAAIANNTGGLVIKGWKNVQALVRSGLAKRMFKIGDQFVVEKETAMTVSITSTEASAGISAASVNESTFLAAIGTAHSGDYEFVYDGATWHLSGESVSLDSYGISVTGTAKNGDIVVVHETATQMILTVLDVDADTPVDSQLTHSLTVGFQDCYSELQFDNKEAMFAFDEGLEAGTYHFTIGSQPWRAGDVNKTLQFTIENDIPAGGQLYVNSAYNATMVGATISVFASSSATTASETVTMTEGDDGTDLGTISDTASGNLNSVQRGFLGSNNYAQSAIRQLINSSNEAGSVWVPQSKFDRPPTWAASTAGFLRGMDPDFVSVIGKVKKRTALNTVTDGGGYVDTNEKVFVLSQTEVYAGLNNNVNEGGPYRYFSEFSDLTTAGGGDDTNRIKYHSGTAKYWWVRSPITGGAYSMRCISPTGSLLSSYYGAAASNGVVPACCIV